MFSAKFLGSIVALVTPFTLDNKIDFKVLASLIEWHIESGTQAIVLGGTTGESATLSDDEKVALACSAVAIAHGRIKLLLGNGSNNTAASVELTKRLNNTGVDGYLTVTPCYNKPTAEGLIAHFSAIAAATTLPIILYNVPSRTLCDMSNEIIIRLAELNNIVGIKDATADLSRLANLITQLKQNNKKDFALLSGDDASALDYCLAGGHGVISVTANVMPEAIAKIQRLIQKQSLNKEQNIEQAKLINAQIKELHQALFIESNPITVKWVLFWMNKLNNANLRLPLLSLSTTARLSLQQILEKSGIQQYPQEN
ncbi:MAG: 4-hydroxy-tetrahydrodipicolinate synthase [Alteromonadaceae bacterium]|nr:4-hydroxy-tetrahydrodipicolinate synthase [Alteromonadaceae bacterium]